MRKIHMVSLGIILLVLVGILLMVWASNRVESFIETEFKEELEYEELEVSVLRKRLVLTAPKVNVEGIQLEATQIKVLGFGVWQYLTKKSVEIDDVLITDPDIRYFPEEVDSSGTSGKSQMQLLINNIEVDHGSFRIVEEASEVFYLSLDHINVTKLGMGAKDQKTGLPFSYATYEIVGDSLFSALDERHHLTLNRLQAREGEAWVEDLNIVSKYGKKEFQQYIPYEKDRFEMLVEEIHLEELDWGLHNDSLFFDVGLLEITSMDLEVYRDKLQPDDTSNKALYSAQIRNSPILFEVEKVEVKESRIVYEERIDEERPVAKVFFTNLYSSIFNLGNRGLGSADFPETRVAVQANLMGESKVKVNWKFDSSNPMEEFEISGEVGSLSAEGINSFLRPAMNIEARGGISYLSFDFTGNDDAATGSMRLKYQDFKINVLKDDGTKKNSFLSAIANFFINNNAVNEEVYLEDLKVERDKTKSFWNYFWLLIREGAISSLL